MRIVFAIITVLVAISILSACATISDDYENFLLDMDIFVRFDICFSKIEDQNTSLYMTAELNALIEDLESWEKNYPVADRANGLFNRAACCLIDSIHYAKADNPKQAKTLYQSAEEYYQNAQAEITKSRAGG